MNTNELLGIIKKNGDTQDDLAEALGISRPTVSAKIHGRGKASFTQPEIRTIKVRYQLSAKQVDYIFFAS